MLPPGDGSIVPQTPRARDGAVAVLERLPWSFSLGSGEIILFPPRRFNPPGRPRRRCCLFAEVSTPCADSGRATRRLPHRRDPEVLVGAWTRPYNDPLAYILPPGP